MSERLEQIKAKPYFNKETRNDRVNSADIVWLINRVEELEEENTERHELNVKLTERVRELENTHTYKQYTEILLEKQRYEKALKDVKEEVSSYIGRMAERVMEITDEALEEEKERQT